MTAYDIADELLVPVVFAAAHPIVQAAREVYGRPLPRLRSQAFLDAPRVVQQAVLIIGGESLVLASPGVLSDDYTGGRFHRIHPLPEYAETLRRRWPPTGDRDLWVRYGPDGPPSNELQRRRAA